MHSCNSTLTGILINRCMDKQSRAPFGEGVVVMGNADAGQLVDYGRQHSQQGLTLVDVITEAPVVHLGQPVCFWCLVCISKPAMRAGAQ